MRKIFNLFLVLLLHSCQQTVDSPENLIRKTEEAVQEIQRISFTEYYSEKNSPNGDTLNLKGYCSFYKKPDDPVFGYHFSVEFPDSGKTLLYKKGILYVIYEKRRKIEKINLHQYGREMFTRELPEYFIFDELLSVDLYKSLEQLEFKVSFTDSPGENYRLDIVYPEEDQVKIEKQLFIRNPDFLPYQMKYRVQFGSDINSREIKIKDIESHNEPGGDVSLKDSWQDFSTVEFKPAIMSEYTPLEKGSHAPDFRLNTANGEQITLAEFKDEYVLLDFWYLACPSCMESIPHLNLLHEKYNRHGLNIIGINSFDRLNGIQQKVMRILRDNPIQYTIARGHKNIDSLYKVKVYPTAYLINKEGVVIYSQLGYSQYMADSLNRILERELPVNETSMIK